MKALGFQLTYKVLYVAKDRNLLLSCRASHWEVVPCLVKVYRPYRVTICNRRWWKASGIGLMVFKDFQDAWVFKIYDEVIHRAWAWKPVILKRLIASIYDLTCIRNVIEGRSTFLPLMHKAPMGTMTCKWLILGKRVKGGS